MRNSTLPAKPSYELLDAVVHRNWQERDFCVFKSKTEVDGVTTVLTLYFWDNICK